MGVSKEYLLTPDGFSLMASTLYYVFSGNVTQASWDIKYRLGLKYLCSAKGRRIRIEWTTNGIRVGENLSWFCKQHVDLICCECIHTMIVTVLMRVEVSETPRHLANSISVMSVYKWRCNNSHSGTKHFCTREEQVPVSPDTASEARDLSVLCCQVYVDVDYRKLSIWSRPTHVLFKRRTLSLDRFSKGWLSVKHCFLLLPLWSGFFSSCCLFFGFWLGFSGLSFLFHIRSLNKHESPVTPWQIWVFLFLGVKSHGV